MELQDILSMKVPDLREFKKNNLHLMGYSEPVTKNIKRKFTKKNIYS